jgi:hypothetical protein
MTGGLIQISTYGSQDLFLTGAPEITFFKVVYRRHTSFSMESLKVTFDDPVEFGKTSMVIIPRIGDLMYKTYVEITIPEINQFRTQFPSDEIIAELEGQLQVAKDNYKLIQDFMIINTTAYAEAYDDYIPENNINATGDMIMSINTIFTNQANTETIDETKNLIAMTTDPDAPFSYSEISMHDIANLFNEFSDKDELFKSLSIGIDKSVKTQKFYFDQILSMHDKLTEATDPHIKFAWIQRLGHAVMESIEIKIGGQKVDKNYGDWLNIWYELSANRQMQETYYKMIGNIESLTNFDRKIKPTYVLKVPLRFWFCKYSGLAIPLVSLEYHNVSLHIKFRKFQELCYIEPNNTIKYSQSEDGLVLDEVPDELNVNIGAQLLIDYIYLDRPERTRFAQSSHEYLIDQLQILERKNVTQQSIQFQINNFVHPSKELIWVSQKVRYTKNRDGSNQCRWDNYSISDSNYENPIIFSSLDFHSYKRVPRLDGNYFNYVQPYETHRTTPSDGINIYGFSLFPEESQPSGSANLSRLSRIAMYMEFDKRLFIDNEIIDPLNIRIYTRNLNILRFTQGMGGLAFVYG